MCLLLIAHLVSPRLPLVVAANRDEFYARPTAPAAFWEDAPQLLAGKDLVGGGTWLGVTRSGRFAALTNFRDPGAPRPRGTSRGHLVRDFLLGGFSAEEYLQQVDGRAEDYAGYNLVAWDAGGLFWYSNVRRQVERLPQGIYGISNAQLDTPWPKVVRGQKALAAALAADTLDPDQPEPLFALLADQTVAPDAELPNTGLPIELERKLAPAFITEPPGAPLLYGTRASTVVTIDAGGLVQLHERSFHPPAQSPAAFSACAFSLPVTRLPQPEPPRG